MGGDHADKVLAVDIVELGEVVAAGDAVGELVVQAAQGQVVGAEGATEAAILVVQRQVFPVGVVAVLGLVQAPAGEGQALDFPGREQAAFEGLRQDAPVVGLQSRQFRDQGADFQLGLGELYFAGQAQFGVFVGGLAVIVGRSRPVSVRSGLESSLTPSMPNASRPKPTVPSV